MHFSITCALFLCVTMLFFLPVQGKYVLNMGPVPPCCTKVSTASVLQPVKKCFVQKDTTFAHCKLNAYIFITKDRQYCVDPSAMWFKDRLDKLKKKGIHCENLMNGLQQHG